MNLGAFAIVTMLGRKEDKLVNLSDYAGLAVKRPGLAAILSVFLLSLAGVPGTAGFAGKFFIFRAALESRLVWLTIIGVVTTVVSFYYYLYVIVQMYMRDPKDEFSDVALPASVKLALLVSVAGTLYMGILPTSVLEWTSFAALNPLR
jgi:NADH-quinone oxidoreductase subunit N